MEQTLQALGGILLKAIPTVVIVLLLHFYLKSMLFKPLEKVLRQRDEATGGARKAAEASLARAEQKAAEYETAIREARAEVYREQEQARAALIASQEAQIKDARKRMDAMIAGARTEIEAETSAARQNLAGHTSELADQITHSVLSGRVA
jgi:F-type H+-transporting ATPase subunit b